MKENVEGKSKKNEESSDEEIETQLNNDAVEVDVKEKQDLKKDQKSPKKDKKSPQKVEEFKIFSDGDSDSSDFSITTSACQRELDEERENQMKIISEIDEEKDDEK